MKINYYAFTGIIRERISAVQLGQDLGLNVGRDGRCSCIFCSGERKDTLRLYPGNRGAYCFRCHKTADVIDILREAEGMSFTEAVKALNDRYGLNLPLDKPDPEKTRKAQEETERKRKEREARQERDKQLLDALWNASDDVYRAEQVLKNEGPKTASNGFTERYIAAANLIDALKDKRDRLFDEVYGGF